MADYDALIERHNSRYQSRLSHLDQLLAVADRRKATNPEPAALDDELATVRREREQLLKDVEQLRKHPNAAYQDESLEEAGPMIIWELVAKRLERLIERVGRTRP